ncbi:class I SAM-dependent methyltransferase [Mucilaginibacter sp. UR6-1]|uniref:class I SAM-dependent methyltransferase n=1 Tax=Mucilaginibacter sp. UR6-1 TaxID=1435643 RepID=UPI001E4ED15F|nr:class I SAM-dependent methyltransferase [Mucilaginibacter sp. UR6-1]MCC8408606.1 class I SAM-dependent methyltransferase [Mucilaginibacter sp. UR6-1]
MDRQMQLYWKAFDQLVSTDHIIDNDLNPIYHFEDQLVDGAIIDIGCGQTSPLIRYADITERRLIGIDNEPSQLVKLRSRMAEIAGADSKAWELITGDLMHSQLPNGPYAMVIMYNILHFFSLDECKEVIAKIDQHLITGSLISICVHSTKHPANDPANFDALAYFKHFFTQSDLDTLFPTNKFERLYRADIERDYERINSKVAALWAEKVITDMKIKDHRTKADIRRDATTQKSTAEIINVYRKR